MSVIDSHFTDSGSCGAIDGTKDLVGVDDALALIGRVVTPLSKIEILSLFIVRDRVLATGVCAEIPVPHFGSAAIDGYALDPAMLDGAGPWRLSIEGQIFAGHAGRPPPVSNATHISTGPPVQSGASVVIPREDVHPNIHIASETSWASTAWRFFQRKPRR